MAKVGASSGAIEKGHREKSVFIKLAGPIQGMALVTFPAASCIFTSPHGYGFKPQYGMMVTLSRNRVLSCPCFTSAPYCRMSLPRMESALGTGCEKRLIPPLKTAVSVYSFQRRTTFVVSH